MALFRFRETQYLQFTTRVFATDDDDCFYYYKK